jgi:phosphohistidine phosphatase
MRFLNRPVHAPFAPPPSVKAAEMLPEIVLTSPLVRARQSADEFCGAAEIAGPILQEWLASGMSPATAVSELGAFREFQRVAIVGHEPDLSRLIEWLLGTAAGAVEVKKGTLAGVRFQPPGRHGSLLFLVPPKLADDLGE